MANLAISYKNELTYTLLKDASGSCRQQPGYISDSAFYINSRIIDYKNVKVRDAKYEVITCLGGNCFLTDIVETVSLVIDLGGKVLRNASDGSRVKVYTRLPSIVYKNDMQGLTILKYGLTKLSDGILSDNKIVKIRLNGSGESYIIKNREGSIAIGSTSV